MKFKKITILGLASILLLSACGNDTKDPDQIKKEAEAAGKIIYDTDEFSLQIPKDWEVIEKSSYPSNVPPEIVVGLRNNIKSDIFTANLTIAKKGLAEEILTRDFAKSSLATIKKSLMGFTLISENEGKIGELNTYLMEVEGKKTSSEPIIRFKQLYIVNNSSGYTVTASYLPTEDESVVNALKEMLESFALK